MKLTRFLVLALCLLLIKAQEEKPEEQKMGLLDKASKMFSTSLTKIQNLFDFGIKTVKEKAEKVYNSAVSATVSVAMGFKRIMNYVACENPKYPKCVEQQKPAIQKLEEKTNDDIAQCEKIDNEKSESLVEGLKTEAAAIRKEIRLVIEKCQETEKAEPMFCIINLEVINDLYTKAAMPETVKSATSESLAIENEAEKCVAKAKEISKSESENIQKQIEACINAA